MAPRILLGVGAAFLTTGAGLIWFPLAFVVAGLCLIVVGALTFDPRSDL